MHDYDETTHSYLRSKQFSKLSLNTKRIYNNGIDTLAPYLAGMLLSEITRPMVIAIRDSLFDQPGKCRIALSVLNNILKYAYDRGWVPQNVASAIGELPPQKEIERWYAEEIDRFLSTAPFYLRDAMMLALYTGQRRSDLVRILWSDITDNVIYVRQRKTGAELWIPMHPKLRRHLDSMKLRIDKGRSVFAKNHVLVNHQGMPWVPDSLRAAFKRHSAKTGLVGKQLHGVRKTTASILGEIGCTPHEIMAITGHQSLKEVQRYTAGADMKKLAQEAMAKWGLQ
jgi:integrase